MFRYDKYYREFGIRKPGDLAKVHKYSDLTMLPMGSVLHIGADLFKSVEKDNVPVPPHSAFAHYAGDRKVLIKFNRHTDVDGNLSLEPDEGIREYRDAIQEQIRGYRTKNIKVVRSAEDFSDQVTQFFNVHAYTPMVCGTMKGYLREYRSTTQIIDHILKNVADGPFHHFLMVPISEFTYKYEDFLKTFREHTMTSMKYEKDHLYIFLMQLLGFWSGSKTPSVFNALSEAALKKLNIVLYNEESDKCVHIRLDKTRELIGNKLGNLKKLYAAIRYVGVAPVEEIKVDGHDRDLLKVEPALGPEGSLNVTGIDPNVTEEDKLSKRVDIQIAMDAQVEEQIANDDALTPQQKRKVITASRKYKDIEVDGQRITDLLNAPTPPLEGMDATALVGDIPDKSVAKSSAVHMHREYIEKQQVRDMVGVLTSYRKNGLHLVGLEKEEIVDDFNQTVRYKAKFVDKDGSEVTVPYILPLVNEDGTFMSNGSLKRLTIQRTNLPICKVSPTRVTLNSNVNKALIDMVKTKSNSLLQRVLRAIRKSELSIEVILGGKLDHTVTLPREYALLATTISRIRGLGLNLCYNYADRFSKLSEAKEQAAIKGEKKGEFIYLGEVDKTPCYMDKHGYLKYGDVEPMRIIDLLDMRIHDVVIRPYSEWTNIMLTNQELPTGFVLACRYGFETSLRMMDLVYEKIPKGTRLNVRPSDIVIPTYDVTFVLRNPSTVARLIVSGMNHFNMKELEHTALEKKDAYFTLLQDKGISISYIKTIDNFFDFFVDYMTENILIEMGEPTTFKGLILRANALLATSEHLEPASASMFRFRSYEMMNAVVSKSMSRAIMTHRNQSVGYKKKISMPEYEIYSSFVTDALVGNVDQVNPLGEVKYRMKFSHMGDGGRTSQAMMIDDRRYPKDGIGTMSESTPVSGNVGIDGMLPLDPTLLGLSGTAAQVAVENIEPGNMLSAMTLMMPGADMDDVKRILFISQQIAQFLPVKYKNHARVRTGAERAVAHMVGLPFAYVAQQDGQIIEVDEKNGMVKIEYKDGQKYALEYGEKYCRHSSASFFVTHNIVVREGFRERSRFKKGDVILYNDRFFSMDPHTNQVDMHIGVFGNVALVEKDRTLLDACLVSQDLSDKLEINPAQVVELSLPKTTFIHKYAPVGTVVSKSDALMVFDETEIGEGSLSAEEMEVLKDINKQIPKAKYDGTIVKIEVFHRCDKSELSDTMRKFANTANAEKNAKAKFAKDVKNTRDHLPYKPILSDKIRGTNIDTDTVFIRFYIRNEIPMGSPDKMVFGTCLKAVASGVMGGEPKAYESGEAIGAILGGSTVQDRQVPSFMLGGCLEKLMEHGEKRALELFFD